MSHYEVGLKLQHDCPINDFTREHPSAVISQWANHDTNLFEISVEDASVAGRLAEDFESAIASVGGRLLRETLNGSRIQLVVSCNPVNRDYDTSRVFGHHNCLELFPTVYTNGWEWYKVLAFSKSDLKSFLHDLDECCRLEIVSKRSIEEGTVKDSLVISAPSLLGDLTANQAEALLLALDNGYYNVPKSITTKQVASKLGLSRSTFDEHLRKAESKVLQGVAPYVLLSAGKRRWNQDPHARTVPPRQSSDLN